MDKKPVDTLSRYRALLRSEGLVRPEESPGVEDPTHSAELILRLWSKVEALRADALAAAIRAQDETASKQAEVDALLASMGQPTTHDHEGVASADEDVQ